MIIIDMDNVGEHNIETMYFPGGEPHVKIPYFHRDKGPIVLYARLRTWHQTTITALLLDALMQQDLEVIPFIPYFPAARQDKSDGRAPITLDVVYRLLNVIEIPKTYVFDAHSYHLFQRLGIYNLMPDNLDLQISQDITGVIAPDEGATTRAMRFRQCYYPNAEFIQCTKKRDPQTGKLSGYHLPALKERGNYLVVDDICDGGGTFNLLAEAFKADRMSEGSHLGLFVSHGIFSQGLDRINALYERIITTDSFCSYRPWVSERLQVIPLLPRVLPLMVK